ncbi:MAG: cyclic nucleotide-binding domain-containing protein [Actinobacteria bacterium]|nr:cyclic nucleotide-binding domain-containing protein [Actinomycetota bacterium]
MPAPVELIERVPLFADLGRRELAQLADSFKERRFDAGDTIAEEGQSGVGFFIVGEGEASVTLRGEVVRTYRSGDYFGEIALIDDGKRTATVKADTALLCYGLTAWDFRPLVESNSAIAWKLLRAMAKLLRQAQQRDS